MESKVGERGQVTIPKTLRDRLGIGPGTQLIFEAEGGRLVAVKADSGDRLDALYGRSGRGRRADEVVKELRGET
jgi:AbrB family looped-hinge helix DNA binding protein